MAMVVMVWLFYGGTMACKMVSTLNLIEKNKYLQVELGCMLKVRKPNSVF